jgi:hypothetical protein
VVLDGRPQPGLQPEQGVVMAVVDRLVDDQAPAAEVAVEGREGPQRRGGKVGPVGGVQGVAEGVLAGLPGDGRPLGQHRGVQPQLGVAEASPVGRLQGVGPRRELGGQFQHRLPLPTPGDEVIVRGAGRAVPSRVGGRPGGARNREPVAVRLVSGLGPLDRSFPVS